MRRQGESRSLPEEWLSAVIFIQTAPSRSWSVRSDDRFLLNSLLGGREHASRPRALAMPTAIGHNGVGQACRSQVRPDHVCPIQVCLVQASPVGLCLAESRFF